LVFDSSNQHVRLGPHKHGGTIRQKIDGSTIRELHAITLLSRNETSLHPHIAVIVCVHTVCSSKWFIVLALHPEFTQCHSLITGCIRIRIWVRVIIGWRWQSGWTRHQWYGLRTTWPSPPGPPPPALGGGDGAAGGVSPGKEPRWRLMLEHQPKRVGPVYRAIPEICVYANKALFRPTGSCS